LARDEQGKPYAVRYDQVNAMLLNEFLKEHRKVEEQETTITQLKKDFRATLRSLLLVSRNRQGKFRKSAHSLK
jgi:hypothetical protein